MLLYCFCEACENNLKARDENGDIINICVVAEDNEADYCKKFMTCHYGIYHNKRDKEEIDNGP